MKLIYVLPNENTRTIDSNESSTSHLQIACREFDVSEFKSYCNEHRFDNSYLKIISYNIRRHFVHIEDFKSLLSTVNFAPEIIILVETWLTNSDQDSAFIDGYSCKHIVRPGVSGGASMYYKCHLNVTVLDDLCVCNNFIEINSIKLKTNRRTIYILGIYRPHSGSVEGFIDQLGIILNKIPNVSCKNVILLGDMNINLLNTSTNHVRCLIDFMQSMYFVPTIKCATRYDVFHDSSSLLDHIWLNCSNMELNCGVILTDLTDHYPIFLNIKTNMSENKTKKGTFRDFLSTESKYSDLNCFQLNGISIGLTILN